MSTGTKSLKALNTFATLSAKEIKSLGKFLRSPYFSNSKRLPRLYEYLKKYHQGLPIKPIDKEKLFRFIFPQEVYKVKKIRDLLSDLSLLMDQFLVVQKVQSEELIDRQLKIKVFGERNLYERFEGEIKALEKKLHQAESKEAHYDLHLFDLHAAHYLHPSTTSIKVSKSIIHGIMTHLDRFFIISKLRYACELISRSNALQEERPDILLLQECLDIAKQQTPEEATSDIEYPQKRLMEIYRRMVLLLRVAKEREVSHYKEFQELEQLFFASRKTISPLEQSALFKYLVNFAGQRIQLGKDNYKQALFDLHEKGLAHRLSLQNNKITDTLFINISNLATGLRKFSWAHTFIQQHQKYLDKSKLESAVYLSTAMVLFGEGKFKQVLGHLEKVDFLTDRYKLWMRSLKTKTFYELLLNDDTYLELLYHFLHSFEQFVRNNKTFSESNKRGYLNYIALVKKMTRPKEKMNADKKAKLKEEVLNKKPLVVRAWLLEKVAQL